jgi:membrane protease YdiL (CAAX protease family)
MRLLPAQFVGYAILFALLFLLFKLQYGRPFWSSLGWVRTGQSFARLVIPGVLVAFGVALLSVVLRTPNIDTPMKALLTDRTSMLLLAVFGITLGPVAEELIFRGFMQPLFVRTFGAIAGVILAALPFGLLHLQQYAFSWRHGLLITLAGTAFGWMRYKSGSTRSAAIMHAAYNFTFFLGLFADRKDIPHSW